MAINPKAYSTDYRDHVGLLHKFSRKFYPFLVNLNLPMDYDDLYGEMLVAFTKATHGYDRSRGITFTAYLGQCCQNHFYTKVLGAYGIKEVKIDSEGKEKVSYRPRCVPTESLEELSEHSAASNDVGGYDMQSFLDRNIESAEESPEEVLIRLQEFRGNMAKLSVETRRYLMVLLGRGSKPEGGYTRDQSKRIRTELQNVYGIAPNLIR